MHGTRREPPPRAAADYEALPAATVEQHLLERYLPFMYPHRGPEARKKNLEAMTDAHRRAHCAVWQPTYRSVRLANLPSTGCGMDSSTCRATRCCGDCKLSLVGYSHHDCQSLPDIMKCERCDQIREGTFGMQFDALALRYRRLLALRKDAEGNDLRTPAQSFCAAGYPQGAAKESGCCSGPAGSGLGLGCEGEGSRIRIDMTHAPRGRRMERCAPKALHAGATRRSRRASSLLRSAPASTRARG